MTPVGALGRMGHVLTPERDTHAQARRILEALHDPTPTSLFLCHQAVATDDPPGYEPIEVSKHDQALALRCCTDGALAL